jgi:hypothetical protein
MKTIATFLLAGAAWTAPALAADPAPCANDPDAAGLRSRMESMESQITRIRSLSDKGEQRRLVELHAKHMHEGLRELRRRESRLEPRCHVAMMQSLLEQMIVHQETVHDLDDR